MASPTSSTSALPPIQSLSIPTHTLVPSSSSSSPYTVYNLTLSTPLPSLPTYVLPHRYSSFKSLHTALSSVARPAVALPPFPEARNTLSSSLSTFLPFVPRAELTPAQLEERRVALETWCRSLIALSAREPRWATHPSFLAFFAPPASSATLPPLTPSTWLNLHSTLTTTLRALRSAIAKRDTLAASNDAAQKADARRVTVEVRRGVEELREGCGRLEHALEEGEGGRIVDGERRRRREMVEVLRAGLGECEVRERVGRPTRSEAASSAISPPPPTSTSTSRVLGAPASLETPQTRLHPTTTSLLSHQQQLLKQQDDSLGQLTAVLRRQRGLAERIGEELEVQREVMDGIERGVDRVSGKMKSVEGGIRKLG